MRLGVLDVGSNTVHLLVVDAYPGARPLPAFSHKTELKLAAQLENGNSLSGPGESRLRGVVEEALSIAEDKGVEDIIASGNLHRIPAIFVTGRNDGILPPNFASRAYFGLNNVVEGSLSPLHYYEVTNAQHLDSFNQFPGYNAMLIPLHRYFIQAMDLMYAHLRNGRPLPPSQVVHTTPRGAGAPPITAANVPPIADAPPPGAQITFTAGQVKIPD